MKRHPQRRSRGTAYVLVLAVTSILIVLGISASQIARGELEQSTLEHDQFHSRLGAQYAQDLIHKFLDGDTAWRTTVQDATWYLMLSNVDGTYRVYYAFVDQIDGDIRNDATQPFMLYTLTVGGDARRAYRIELIPDEDGNLTRNANSFEQILFDEL